MTRTGDFAQRAIADEGKRRKDATIIASQKGETTKTTFGVSGQTIVVQ